MSKTNFNSTFKKEIESYLNDKQLAGFKERSFLSELRKFDQFCVQLKIDKIHFTEEHSIFWLKMNENESKKTYCNRINKIKHFLVYLSLKGYSIYITESIPSKQSDFIPHIYTDDEIARYFNAVDTYASCQNKMTPIQLPIIFRILYCCGTRIDETLRIRKKYVDLKEGIIKLVDTKNKSERYIVLSEELLSLLCAYANKCFYLYNDEDYIFGNTRYARISASSIYKYHRDFLNMANIPYLGGYKGPRVHDWRHTFAVSSYKQMIDKGYDMYVALPILSTYLGHKSIVATEKYIRLTRAIYPHIEEKMKDYISLVFEGDDKNEVN